MVAVTRKELAGLFRKKQKPTNREAPRDLAAFDNAGRFYRDGCDVHWHNFGSALTHHFKDADSTKAFMARIRTVGIQEFPL